MTFEVNQRVKCKLWNCHKWVTETHTGIVVIPENSDGHVVIKLDNLDSTLHFLPEKVEPLNE